ncbi:hypothetical protein [Alterisphingorhabdus coralli]|uniref:SMI1/KNR4 family protein n=1 Tax=Alterisphingorhabdus coralli TaxID=3071408 RepID=A0AA97F6F9_9SPHN|nr:hypothetical protein [Parasphingorhabdus sp. SCSIO 66989]WOE73977.1 hypothetical protein RB602_08875 [Parasphingorhabdus sp. SCSIO 66989]
MQLLDVPEKRKNTDIDAVTISRINGLFSASCDEYLAFCRIYGSVGIADFLWIRSPITENEFLNIFSSFERILPTLFSPEQRIIKDRTIRRSDDRWNFLPFAVSDNGDEFFIVENRVVAIPSRDPDYFDTQLSLEDFLCHVMNGAYVEELFPVDLEFRKESIAAYA